MKARPAVASDRAQVEALLLQAGLPLEGVEAHFASFFVVEEAGQIVAASGLETYGTHALLRSVVVAPSKRSAGLGRIMLEVQIASARAAELHAVLLLTETAESFFAHHGFRPVKRDSVPHEVRASAEFQGACPESAIAMRLDLAPLPQALR
jgi:N-acetylglutamate synthase-like GNAT family acetyltransferase